MTPVIGHPRIHFRIVDSTNARARRWAAGGAPDGTLVTAAEQTAGRGRQGRAWSAPAGSSVLMSLVVRRPSRLLSLAAGVAVAETAEAFGAPDVSIKWPNDVWIAGRKVAGVLVEGRPQEDWAVLGIGVNVAPGSFPPELADRATALGLEDVEAVLARLLEHLGEWVGADAGAVLDALAARDVLLGREISWADGSGIAAGIDATGGLRVDTAAGSVTLDAGEVHLRLG